MQLPSSVLEILDTQKVNYNVSNFPPRKNIKLVKAAECNMFVKSLLVEDGKGRAQILLPADCILDVDGLFRQFGRKFGPVSRKFVRQELEKAGLDSLPAIPNWQGLTTYIDSSLLKKDMLLLDAGTHDQILEINQEDFVSIVSKSQLGNFSIKSPILSDDPAEDEAMILSAVQKFTERRIKQRLDETLELPPLPETAQRIIKLRADPNADINDLTNIVEIDPSLAAQVVSWASSPYYSAPGKIKSVHDAIVRVLGFDMVLNLALGLALGRTFKLDALSKRDIDEYWRASVYNAAAVEGLVTSIAREHRPSFGMAYLSGLLNNFGYLIMAEVFPPYFKTLERLSSCNPHLPRPVVDHYIMGITGDQLAAWLLDNWNMPEEIVTALRHQYNAHYDGDHAVYPHLIFVAKQMLAEQGFGENYGVHVEEETLLDLHLDPESARATISNILEAGDDLDAIAEKMRG